MRVLALVLVLGSLGVAACWSGGGGKPAATPAPNANEVAITDAEPLVGDPDNARARHDRQQAIEQARAAGILGTTAQQQGPSGPPPPAPAGPLDKASIRREIRAHLKAVRLCYEERLIDEPALQGTTMVTFAIGPDGRVTSATGAGFDGRVDACVADVIKRIPFPAPDGGATVNVSYPFTFKPAS